MSSKSNLAWVVITIFVFGSNVLAEDFPRIIKPVMVWTGTDSKQTKASFTLCNNDRDWWTVWQKHHAGETDHFPPCPDVDFEEYMLVAIFHGESSMNHGVWVRQVVEEEKQIRVRYMPNTFQLSTSVDAETASKLISAKTFSFAFVVLPKSRKAVVLEEDVQFITTAPAKWKERARFPARERQ